MKQTPQEYAENIFYKYYNLELSYKIAIQCAIIDVTNTLDALKATADYKKDIYYNEVLTILKSKL